MVLSVFLANRWINICELTSWRDNGLSGRRAPSVLYGGGNTKFGKRIRNIIVTAAITTVVFLPSLVYLATLTTFAHVAPNYCNSAGGCPWT
jgi:hypothetical protein